MENIESHVYTNSVYIYIYIRVEEKDRGEKGEADVYIGAV